MSESKKKVTYEPLRNNLRLFLAGLFEREPERSLVYGFFGQERDGKVLYGFIAASDKKIKRGISELGFKGFQEMSIRAGAAEFEHEHGEKVALVIEWTISKRLPLATLVELMSKQATEHVVATKAPDDLLDVDLVQFVIQ